MISNIMFGSNLSDLRRKQMEAYLNKPAINTEHGSITPRDILEDIHERTPDGYRRPVFLNDISSGAPEGTEKDVKSILGEFKKLGILERFNRWIGEARLTPFGKTLVEQSEENGKQSKE